MSVSIRCIDASVIGKGMSPCRIRQVTVCGSISLIFILYKHEKDLINNSYLKIVKNFHPFFAFSKSALTEYNNFKILNFLTWKVFGCSTFFKVSQQTLKFFEPLSAVDYPLKYGTV